MNNYLISIPIALLLLLAPPAGAADGGSRAGAKYRGPAEFAAMRPPISPKWVFEPWVWEDIKNTEAALLELVRGYLERGIPVGAVIIDSPWEYSYNDFIVDSMRYPHFKTLVDSLHKVRMLGVDGIKTVLWITNIINEYTAAEPSFTGPSKASIYDEGADLRYYLNCNYRAECDAFEWWKGQGALIDYFNPRALTWWHRQMDKVLDLGIDGWKVDGNGFYSDEYNYEYFKDFYYYSLTKNPEAAILARGYNAQDGYGVCPLHVATATWVGDQVPEWGGVRGFEGALHDVFKSAHMGYSVVGSDIGGFADGERSKELFLRWTQFGALCPLMENGGHGTHVPWEFDEETVEIYRYFALLHHQLVPYFYSYNATAHKTGVPIMRPFGSYKAQWRDDWRYLLGENILVAAIEQNDTTKLVAFPDGEWIDFWDETRVYRGGETELLQYPLSRYPIFLRRGAIIPMNVSDATTGHGSSYSAGLLTVLFYPDSLSQYTYYRAEHDSIRFRIESSETGLCINASASDERYMFRVKYPRPPQHVTHNVSGLSNCATFAALETAAHGWWYDEGLQHLWIKFDAAGGASDSVGISETVTPVELSHFSAAYAEGGVMLHWCTVSETNTYGFEVQRKPTTEAFADEWLRVGFVEGRGTTTTPQSYSYCDAACEGCECAYRLKIIDTDGSVSYSGTITVDSRVLSSYELFQNYPNPFNSSTKITFVLPAASPAEVVIFNASGAEVKNIKNTWQNGVQTVYWDGRDAAGRELPSGIYFVRLETGRFSATRKILLLR